MSRDLRGHAQNAGGAAFTLRDVQRTSSTFENARLQIELLAKEMRALIPGA
jgi:hypothetical protein